MTSLYKGKNRILMVNVVSPITPMNEKILCFKLMESKNVPECIYITGQRGKGTSVL